MVGFHQLSVQRKRSSFVARDGWSQAVALGNPLWSAKACPLLKRKAKMSSNAEKLVSHLAEKIGSRIESGDYPLGSRLRQEALAEEFEVSRTPVREALRLLEVKGLVTHLPNQGSIVRAPSAREIREAYQVRAELEGLASELAVEWIRDDQVDKMKAAQKRFAAIVETLSEYADGKSGSSAARAKALPTWIEANDAFHRVIMDASGNVQLAEVISNLHIGFTKNVMLSAGAMDGRRMRENVAQHDAILAAIERHDALEAKRTMKHHVLRSGEIVVRWLESHGSLGADPQ